MNDEQDYKGYERSVKAELERFVEENLHGHPITVHGSRIYQGKSGRHQIDVSASGKMGGVDVLIIGECKCYKRKVGKREVTAFSAIKADLEANFAFMFTTVGFDSGAQEFAEAKDIKLVEQPQRPEGGSWRIVIPVAALIGYLQREVEGRSHRTTNRMNPIPTENQRPGTRSWINTNASVDGNRRSTDIEGFCSKPSYRAGDLLQISVSSSAPFVVEFYRMGFYGGNGGRLMRQHPVTPGTKHDDPPTGDLQVRECNWPVSVQFNIPFDWPSGVYLGKLTQVNVASPTGSYVIFVVRDDRQCDFLFKCSETTWSAYNGWPDNFSLYDFHGEPPKVGYWGPGIRVSFDRPYAMSQPWYMQHEPERCNWMIGASQFLIYEYPLLFWMESQGFDVSYLSCLDLRESSPVNLRQRARALLATGHDEYYSVSMHDNLRNAVEATDDIPQNGLSVAFFCAGSVTGVLELTASTFDGSRQNRIIRRKGRWGPITPWLMTIAPEQAGFTDGDFADAGELMGARLVEPAVGVANWRCVNTGGPLASRLYNGTDLHDGDGIRGLIGHEFTGNPVGRPGLEVVAEDHLIGGDGLTTASTYTATIFPGPKGNFVFNASTMWWPQFLNGGTPLPFPSGGEPRFNGPSGIVSPDPTEMHRVQLMTKNLFEMFLS